MVRADRRARVPQGGNAEAFHVDRARYARVPQHLLLVASAFVTEDGVGRPVGERAVPISEKVQDLRVGRASRRRHQDVGTGARIEFPRERVGERGVDEEMGPDARDVCVGQLEGKVFGTQDDALRMQDGREHGS